MAERKLGRIERMMRENDARIGQFLAYLKAGASIGSAAHGSGLTRRQVDAAYRQGMTSGGSKESQRFARMVKEAIAESRILAEAALKERDPKWWLSRGPALLLGDDWADKAEGEAASSKALVEQEDLCAALEALHSSGISIDSIIGRGLLRPMLQGKLVEGDRIAEPKAAGLIEGGPVCGDPNGESSTPTGSGPYLRASGGHDQDAPGSGLLDTQHTSLPEPQSLISTHYDDWRATVGTTAAPEVPYSSTNGGDNKGVPPSIPYSSTSDAGVPSSIPPQLMQQLDRKDPGEVHRKEPTIEELVQTEVDHLPPDLRVFLSRKT